MEKAGLIGLVKLRYIESDEKLSLRGDKLREAIRQDRDNGLIPFFVSRALVNNINPIVLISYQRCAQLLEQQEPALLTTFRRLDQFARRSSCGSMSMLRMRDLHLSAQSSEAG